MLNTLFKKEKYIAASSNATEAVVPKIAPVKEGEGIEKKPNIPSEMWVKCTECGQILYRSDIEENLMTCQFCNAHFRMFSQERIAVLLDEGSFQELDKNMVSVNPLNYPNYESKLKSLSKNIYLNEAVVTGLGKINGMDLVVAVMDSRFMMGSMGSVVGEKLTRAVEKATEMKLPIVIFTASGGARMQEGIFSLMQMAKVSGAIAKHNEAGLLYITVLTDPTTGGVTASFAMLGDIILSEPNVLIGFAGRRVIEQTIKQKLPYEFQKAEFLLNHGFVDSIIHRKKLKETIGMLLMMHKEDS
ncbi:acetyl-CoA carboxylase, carboxyltransferase subunit beta [Paraclostridium ghonii]|uniref:Acetyl-coenzyme A carboxylase carboxyl transferase subunit beta n=1 Tax=Paraclostridium ghonii TaxID=29358 RepID=A0ABU0N050_9FIRM|nr:acetyl-CoA carboxylase, carboxyltransferase subunit beta [Paeniclostridium ghonii]MDQ0556540.1 acetyl-CoA carboxylase carboxyl transferase subunit beta [Paeniclostridium ghonii]